MEYAILNNGVKMPLIGLGVMEIENNIAGEQVILNALHAGYRLIDTANVYFNEETMGRAIKRAVFHVRSFLSHQNFGYKMQDMKTQKKHSNNH